MRGAIVGAAAVIVLYIGVWVPFRVNTIKRAAAEYRDRISAVGVGVRTAAQTRAHLKMLTRYERFAPHDVELLVLIGLYRDLLGQHAQAASYYKAALRLDQRPEIYLNLAAAEMDLGMREESIKHYALAYEFEPQKELRESPLGPEILRQVGRTNPGEISGE